MDEVKYSFEIDGVHITCDQDGRWAAGEQLLSFSGSHQTELNSILFPNYDALKFLTKIALQAMPQTPAVPWLAGKGWGCELAIQGHVQGRVRFPISVPIRTHRDMEMYNVPTDTEGFFRYPERWPFGGQEYFPEMKMVRNLPAGQLTNTAETVEFEGVDINVPRLELLCVDKFIGKGSVGRDIGGKVYTDAEVLMACYDLDYSEMEALLDQHYILPNIERTKASTPIDLEKHFMRLGRNILRIMSEPGTKEEFANFNRSVQRMQELVKQGQAATYNGVVVQAFEPLTDEDYQITTATEGGQTIVFTDDYQERTQFRAVTSDAVRIAEFDSQRGDLAQSYTRALELRADLLRRDLKYSPHAVTTAHFKRS